MSEIMMLPAAFGAIQLGETFSSCLSVNSEASVDIEGATLRVEMQTATTKTVLAEFGGPDFSIAAGDTMERVVHHEIKELGQHVLACTVSYRLPPGARPHPAQDGHEIQSFRKFYKFAVSRRLIRFPSAMLNSLPGYQSTVCQDESPRAKVAIRSVVAH